MNWKHALRYSDYWTWFTEWLLSFGGKAAWPILIVSTLYMGAELYPGVNLPSGLNFAVFLAQLFALDMGGMGLVSLARQARDEGNAEGARQAGNFGRVLVGIVIASMVTIGVKQFLSNIPALTANSLHHAKGTPDDSIMATLIDPAIMVVEFILVIARVVCAVLYGKVMHSLKSEHNTPHPPTQAIQWSLSWSMVALAAHMQQGLQQLTGELEQRMNTLAGDQRQAIDLMRIDQQRMLMTVQEVENSVPSIDQAGIINAVIEHFAEQFEAGMKRLAERSVQVSMQGQTPALPERLNDRPNSKTNSKQPAKDERKIVRLTPGNRGGESHQDAIYRLLEENESRGPRELARLVGCSPATAKTYRDLYIGNRSERNGTAD